MNVGIFKVQVVAYRFLGGRERVYVDEVFK